MKSKTLIIGGSNGIGLAIANVLSDTDTIIIADKVMPDSSFKGLCEYKYLNLLSMDFSILDDCSDIDKLIITAGIGKLSLFDDLSEQDIINTMTINTTAIICIIKKYYKLLLSKPDFYCAIMVSISGFMSSPFFSVYGASKAALKIFIESVNVELKKSGSRNQILNVSPGSIKGTKFGNGDNDLMLTTPLAVQIIDKMMNKDDLFIPQYDEIFKVVLERYHNDFRLEGEHSYDYKIKSGRVK